MFMLLILLSLHKHVICIKKAFTIVFTVSVHAAHRWVFPLHGPSLSRSNRERSSPQIQYPSVHREFNHYKLGQFSLLHSWICAHLDVWGGGQGSHAKGVSGLSRHACCDRLHRAALQNTSLSSASRWRVPLHLQGFDRHGTTWCSNFCVIHVCRICQWQGASEAVWDCATPETWNGHYGQQMVFYRQLCTVQSLPTSLSAKEGTHAGWGSEGNSVHCSAQGPDWASCRQGEATQVVGHNHSSLRHQYPQPAIHCCLPPYKLSEWPLVKSMGKWLKCCWRIDQRTVM